MTRHPLDLTALVWGALFVIGSLALLANEYANVSLDAKWLLPAALITAGIGGIANALRPSRN